MSVFGNMYDASLGSSMAKMDCGLFESGLPARDVISCTDALLPTGTVVEPPAAASLALRLNGAVKRVGRVARRYIADAHGEQD